jgi:cardiolipin synthase
LNLSWLPNAICVGRMLLVAPIAYVLVRGQYELTLVLFAIAAISDAADGWLAKTFGWQTELGKALDPVADKLLLVTVFLTLAALGLVPAWLAAAAVIRDVVIAGGATAYHRLFGRLDGGPSAISKLNTGLQVTFVVIVIANAAWHGVPDGLVIALGAATFVTTVVSGIDYVLRYSRMAIANQRARTRAAA